MQSYQLRYSLGAVVMLLSLGASALTISFDDLVHGTIIDDEYLVSHGVIISVENTGGGPDIAAAFDTTLSGTRDSDLEGPWSGGNLPIGTDLGRILIIQENDVDHNNDGILDHPDDEGSRPAGTITFEFGAAVDSFGFDLIDVEGPEEYGQDRGYFAAFYLDGTEVGRVGFGELVDPGSPFYDGSIVYGDNYINRIEAIDAVDLGVDSFDTVEINFGGSAGIDNINFDFYMPPPPPNNPIPEPTTTALLSMGIVGFVLRNRKRFIA